MDITAINKILLDFFPIVLNKMILEYMSPIQYDFYLTKTLKYTEQPIAYHYSDGQYKYTYYKGILEVKLEDEYHILFNSHCMCAYKERVYVIDGIYIHVFNKKCKKVRTINNCADPLSYCSIIKIVEDRIFLGYHRTYYIIIYDLYGRFIDKIFLYNHILQKPTTMYNMELYNNKIYVSTYNNFIIVYSHDSKCIQTYDCNVQVFDTVVDNFFLIDDTMYMCSVLSDKIYGFNGLDFIEKDISIPYHINRKIAYKNNSLYVRADDRILIYNIVATPMYNISKLLTIKN